VANIYHPERRELTSEKDVYLKIADILYFYKVGKADRQKTTKRLNFLKLIVKKNFDNEKLLEIIEDSKKLLELFDKAAYEEYLKRYRIEDLIKGSGILKFLK